MRLATLEDVAVIARHRVLMFHDMQEQPVATAAEVERRTRIRIRRLIESGAYVGWLAELASGAAGRDANQTAGELDALLAPPGRIAAGLGVIERPRLPRHSNPEGRPEGYILNVYTERAHRRRGLATRLMRTAMDWAAGRGVTRLALHASAEGRLVYTALGFEATNEMSRAIGP